ncbi:carboxylesterase family protein [Vibrio breoganii]|uniref:Carboxylesterase/lipase family protein n=2 Tax=Vibrio TaxID=662 RepID=A0ABX1UA88_9VIBR|nr:carboxylesterase family protein [Vibrio breoganii]NMO74834.1 carboxylesterase/lipase family protein [Vibrio breoganii]NMR71336.1 carboxylesterase/lipase family protein [Vibrio breoganii]PML87557.1 para-nitrobenzyl esterase [Vibrio breoganii]
MTLLHRSLVAIAISASLAGCYTDTEATVPMPENPEPLLPLPAEEISLEIGDSIVNAMKESVVITTLEGEEKRVNVETFKGIEYATQTRFEHSEYAPLADEVDATEFGYACMQNRATAQTQDEDCLNLNIWRPAGVDAGEDLPVYVFIHGGDFEYGSGSEALVHGDTVVAQGRDDGKPFIYVSLNYRLGALGTQWVEGSKVDGNYGLGDQKRALEWVHNNIASFGGAIDNVTVIGQGSGAMSVGFLQQDESIAGEGKYFQRAIMQSNPYGFEYPSYRVAKANSERMQEIVEEVMEENPSLISPEHDLNIIMQAQAKSLGGVEQLKNWLTRSLPIDIPSIPGVFPGGIPSDNTPMSSLMPFAPYIKCDSWLGTCLKDAKTPIESGLSVKTVLGTNANETNGSGMLFRVTFLIPFIIENWPDSTTSKEPAKMAQELIEWLNYEHNVALVENKLISMTEDDFSAELTMPKTAYSAVTSLFFGLKLSIEDDEGEEGVLSCFDEDSETLEMIECVVSKVDISGQPEIQDALNLKDFSPSSEADLGSAIDNMKQFGTLLNDTLFDGPARHMAANSTETATLYRFDKKPSFNMWNYNTAQDEETGEYSELSILDLFKTIGCISGACNGSELPFMFNKAVRFDGSEIHPNTGEKALMNEMSRLWFSEELFTNYQYSDSADNVLVIEAEGFSDTTTYDWDYVTNPGVDPKLRQGRLTGLEEQGLMPWQWYLN